MTLVRALLVALAFALAIAACERVVVLTPGFDGGFDGLVPDTATRDTGEPGLDGGGLPDALVGDAS